MEIKRELMRLARECGICKDGYKDMKASDVDGLIDYYIKTIDWSLENAYPPLPLLRAHFNDIGHKGVYVDREFHGEEFASKQAYVFHHCKGVIHVAMDYDNAIIPMLYFANGCDIEVRCVQRKEGLPPLKVPLYITDGQDNDIRCQNNDLCVFTVYTIKTKKGDD